MGDALDDFMASSLGGRWLAFMRASHGAMMAG
jgi:hypothetical protein